MQDEPLTDLTRGVRKVSGRCGRLSRRARSSRMLASPTEATVAVLTGAGEPEWARLRPGGSGSVLLVFRVSWVPAGLTT